jgi:hypothetical protein
VRDTTVTEAGTDTDPAAEVDKWKAMARKHEQTAKANADAADRLAKLEAAQMSEAEKAADRLTKAEERAVQAEAKALRREIALEHKLSTDDAGLLDNVTDETAMRALAARLAGAEATRTAADADTKKNGNVVPKEGSTTPPRPDDVRAFARGLFGSTDPH